MSLPRGSLKRTTVALSGGDVEVRGLTLAESDIVNKAEGTERVVRTISLATGTSPDDVRAWLEDCPAGDAIALLNAVLDASGLSGAARFRD